MIEGEEIEEQDFDDLTLRTLALVDALRNSDGEAMEALMPVDHADTLKCWMSSLSVLGVVVGMLGEAWGLANDEMVGELRRKVLES